MLTFPTIYALHHESPDPRARTRPRFLLRRTKHEGPLIGAKANADLLTRPTFRLVLDKRLGTLVCEHESGSRKGDLPDPNATREAALGRRSRDPGEVPGVEADAERVSEHERHVFPRVFRSRLPAHRILR
jgi:hypothetical protein